MPKISQLPTDSSPTLTDYVPVLDQETTTTKRSLLSSIRDLVFDNIPSASPINTGWLLKNPSGSTLPTPNTVTYNGNRSYDLVFNSVDLTSYLSPGMRTRFTRTTAAPTQCTSLNGTTQYFNKTSPNKLTFTDDFVVSAWVKLTSYTNTIIASRYNGTSGWYLNLDANGRPLLAGLNGSSANFSYVVAYQSVPLNKWVHITAQLDMSAFTATTTTSYVMIDGVDVPASVSRGGTNPTTLVQAGNLEIGAHNGGLLPFPGKIAQVAIFSAKVTQATMRGYMSQGLSGSETSLASAYSFNNSIADLNTTTPNDLTAQGSATATNSDSPFGIQGDGSLSTTLTYGVITKTAFSTNTTLTVQCHEGNTIPTSGGISAMAYSIQKNPYNFPSARSKWRVEVLTKVQYSQLGSGSWYSQATQITVPIGEWGLGYDGMFYTARAAGTTGTDWGTLSTSSSAESDGRFKTGTFHTSNVANIGQISQLKKSVPVTCDSQTVYYLLVYATSASTTIAFRGDLAPTILEAECGYL